MQVADRILKENVTVTVSMLTDAEKFCSIPGKELQVVVQGCTIRIGSVTWLRRVGAVCKTPDKAAECHNCKSLLKEKTSL